MNLSAQIILRELQPLFSFPFSDNLSQKLNLGRPIFLQEQSEWPEGRICLCECIPSGLMQKKIPDAILIFVSGRESLHAFLKARRSPELPAPESAGPGARGPLQPWTGDPFLASHLFPLDADSPLLLFNRLQEIFDKYEAWDMQLSELLRQDGSLTAMLDCCQQILGNPLLLQAADFFLIAHSSMIDENPQLAHLTDAAESFETITISKLDPEYTASREKKEPFFLPAYLSGSRQLCVNLFRHGIFAYRLILAEEISPLLPEQAPLLQPLSSYLEPLLLRADEDSLSESYSLERTLTEIISEKMTDYAVINSHLSEYGWTSGHSYCCMTLKMTSLDSQNLTSHYLCHHFEEIVPGSCAFQYEEELVVFINLTRFDGTIDKLLLTTTPFLRDSFLKTGVSSAVRGTIDLRYCYLQASIALDSGSKYQNYRWVHRFENISISYLCDCCIRDMPAHMVCSEKLIRLQAYDAAHNSQFCQTLRVFLDCHLNAVQAARRLYIHRSTFLYRLERIREIIEIDFNDEEMLFYLMLSYRITDLQNAALANSVESVQV